MMKKWLALICLMVHVFVYSGCATIASKGRQDTRTQWGHLYSGAQQSVAFMVCAPKVYGDPEKSSWSFPNIVMLPIVWGLMAFDFAGSLALDTILIPFDLIERSDSPRISMKEMTNELGC